VKKSPAKKKGDSQPQERKPKVIKSEQEQPESSKYFQVKEEPVDPDENLEKIKRLKKVKKEIKTEENVQGRVTRSRVAKN
jgi:hypothetical protein